MKVEQLMTKQVDVCYPDHTLNDAARVMWERDCGVVPVVDGPSRRLVGVVTDRDVCMAAYTRGHALWQIRVGDVMTAAVQACQPWHLLAEAEAAMRRTRVHRLPVVDDAGQLLGVISLCDIAREAARETGSKKPEVTPAEIGETLAAIRQPRAIAAVGTP